MEDLLKSLPAELPKPTMADILIADHRDTTCLLQHFSKVSDTSDKLMMEKLTDAIALTIRLHSQAEYDTLYPFMEKTMGGAKESGVEQSLEEHTTIENEVKEAMRLRKEGGQELSTAVDKVFKDFVDHMCNEEDKWVPALLKKAHEEELADVALNFMRVKEEAPLDPQPPSSK